MRGKTHGYALGEATDREIKKTYMTAVDSVVYDLIPND